MFVFVFCCFISEFIEIEINYYSFVLFVSVYLFVEFFLLSFVSCFSALDFVCLIVSISSGRRGREKGD